MISEWPEHVLVGVADQPHLVPEVLDPLAQLVEVGDARLLLGGAQALSPTPIGPVKPRPDQLPPIALQRQRIDPAASRRQAGGSFGHRPLDRAIVVGRPVLLLELLPEGIEIALRRRPEPLRQAIERFHQDLSVPEAAQTPRHLPVVVVLATPDVFADLLANEPQGRADLLDVLARLVDRLRGLGARLASQLGDRVVNLSREDSPHSCVHGLAREQPVGIRVEVGSVSSPKPAETDSCGCGGPRGHQPGGLARILYLRERPTGCLLEVIA